MKKILLGSALMVFSAWLGTYLMYIYIDSWINFPIMILFLSLVATGAYIIFKETEQ